MHRFPRQALWPVLLLSASLAGCAGGMTAQEAEQTIDDYDRAVGNEPKGWGEDEPGLLDSFFGRDRETESEVKAQEQRIAQLERQLQERALEERPVRSAARAAVASAAGPQPRIAVYTLPEVADSALGGQLQTTFAGTAADYPLTLLGQTQVEQELARSGCGLNQPAECAARLGIYPGASLLAVVEKLDVTDDRATVTYRILDTVADVSYEPETVRLPAVDGEVPRPSLEALADKVFVSALERSRLTPWTTYAFSREGDDFVLSAGAAAGLEPGMRLRIHESGRLIRSPSGAPAAWMPGERKGVLEVQRLLGANVATARLVTGQPPEPQDPILLEK